MCLFNPPVHFVMFCKKRNILIHITNIGVYVMKKVIPFWQMTGFIFTAIIGTILHFLFDWTGGNVGVALFSAVNESIWEHLKLLFYPMVAVAIIEYFFWGKGISSFWYIKLIGILIGLIMIPVIYYTYTGILGINADWFNITIFFLSAAVVFWFETKLFQREYSCGIGPGLAIAIIFLLAVTFTVFTFIPPHIPFFQDPMTGTYGFQK